MGIYQTEWNIPQKSQKIFEAELAWIRQGIAHNLRQALFRTLHPFSFPPTFFLFFPLPPAPKPPKTISTMSRNLFKNSALAALPRRGATFDGSRGFQPTEDWSPCVLRRGATPDGSRAFQRPETPPTGGTRRVAAVELAAGLCMGFPGVNGHSDRNN
ncbi:MAG: hypothetical protein NTW03_23195 [Verrucomicrobia bacterium]|nr:hypothetical protein [Verrucomicrobiota bacterium]